MKSTRVILSIVVIAVMLFNLCGCTSNNLMVGITPNEVAVSTKLKTDAEAVNKFSLELFKNSVKKGENTLVSPLSVIYALGMTANGAKGETLKQMENVLGMKSQDLNVFLYSFMDSLKKNESAKLKLANSVWLTADKRFNVNKDFLQTNADYYGADIFKTPMDKTSVEDINSWVEDKTESMIKDIVDDTVIKEDTLMCLINALCFDAEWLKTYQPTDVREGKFKTASSKKQKCQFMYGEESTYLESENAVGFVKPYKDSSYAFVAILPQKNITIENYLETLTYDSLNQMLKNSIDTTVETAIPKFKTEFDFQLNEILSDMGMPLAFEPINADFSGIGKSESGNIYISKVKQKTFISVDEEGTRAGAATFVAIDDCFWAKEKKVYLNRPFVYMIIDTDSNIPIFMGVLNNIK